MMKLKFLPLLACLLAACVVSERDRSAPDPETPDSEATPAVDPAPFLSAFESGVFQERSPYRHCPFSREDMRDRLTG